MKVITADEKAKAKRRAAQRRARFLLTLLSVFLVLTLLFCGVGLYLFFSDTRNTKILYEEGVATYVIPGKGTADFGFTVVLPKMKNRSYALKIHDVVFGGGGLDFFTDMNGGEWEYRLDKGGWQPLILTGEDGVLEEGITAGEHILSLRATDRLDENAAGGRLDFKLELTRTS